MFESMFTLILLCCLCLFLFIRVRMIIFENVSDRYF